MASLKDIAVECGVSVATVSKALNGHKEISESTAAKVLSAAEKLSYMPNSAARALKTNRTYNLGVLFVDETRSGLTHEYFSTVLDSFKVEAEANGYDITFINHNIGSRTASYLEHCRYRGVDGVVIACVDFFDPQVMELVHSDIPVVTIDHTFDNHVSVLSDNIQGMHDLVQYVYSMGHRRIAFIHGENTSVTTNRLTSFYRTCLEFGLEPPDEYVRAACYHDTHKAARCTQEPSGTAPATNLHPFPRRFFLHRRHERAAGSGTARTGGHFRCRIRRHLSFTGAQPQADHPETGYHCTGQNRCPTADRPGRAPQNHPAGQHNRSRQGTGRRHS